MVERDRTTGSFGGRVSYGRNGERCTIEVAENIAKTDEGR